MENFRNKQFVSFKSRALPSSVMNSPAIQLHAAQEVNHLFVQCVLRVHLSSRLGYQISCPGVTELVFK